MKKIITTVLAVTALVACNEKPKAEKEKETIVEEVKIKAKEVNYMADTTALKGYLAYNETNEGKKVPGILVIHEWWGHNDYVRERADQLAELGYVAFALDMYGDGKLAEHPQDAGKFAGQVMSNLPEAKMRFDAALKELKKNPQVDTTKIAAIGYCFGGSVALTMADMGEDLDAVAAFHSGIALPVMPNEKLKARVLVANGGQDPMVKEEDITTFKQALDSVGADYKYITYPNAKHAYTSKAADSLGKKFNLPLAYDAEADAKSWEELKSFLKATF